MLRKLLIPLAATALLAGCVTTAPYGYGGQGSGDYYYGSPSVEYQYYGVYGDPYYGYGPYRPGYSVWGYPGYYGGYYGNPYYGYPYYSRPRRPDNPGPHRPEGGPWRDIGDVMHHQRDPQPGPTGAPPASDSAWRDAQAMIRARRGSSAPMPGPAPAMPQIERRMPGFGGGVVPAPRSSAPMGGVIRRGRPAGREE